MATSRRCRSDPDWTRYSSFRRITYYLTLVKSPGRSRFDPRTSRSPSAACDQGRRLVASLRRPGATPTTPSGRRTTGPYGHAGQFAALEAFIDHYSRNAEKLRAYSDADIPEPLLVGTLVENREAVIAARSPFILAADFDAAFVAEVTAFNRALTDDRARDLAHVVPERVPSGLPVDW